MRFLSESSLRLVNTRVCKWPSRKERGLPLGAPEVCAAEHLGEEVDAFQPRVILTYNNSAIAFVRGKFPSLALKGLPGVRSVVCQGWAGPVFADGYRTAVLLVTGKKDRFTAEKTSIRDMVLRLVEPKYESDAT